jgi:imidazolonepropionase-like amidohydrolase
VESGRRHRRAQVPCSIINVDSPGGKLEARYLDWKTGGVLERAGVLTAIHTDDYITDSRLFLRSAALSVRAGMSAEGRFAPSPATGRRCSIWKIGSGSLEPGKDADFVDLVRAIHLAYTPTSWKRGWKEGWSLTARDLKIGCTPSAAPGAGQPEIGASLLLSKLETFNNEFHATDRRWRFDVLFSVHCDRPVSLVRLALLLINTPCHRANGDPRRPHPHHGRRSHPHGIVLVRDGRIEAVGGAGTITIPHDYQEIHAPVVTPGLIDAHTVVGLAGILNQPHDQEQLDRSAPIQPELRAIDGYNPRDPLVDWMRSLGVTTLHTGHAPAALIAGQTMIVKTYPPHPDAAVLNPPP